MIEIVGAQDDTREREYAEKLARLAAAADPAIDRSDKIVLKILPNVQCFGQQFQDIDLLVFYADYRDEAEWEQTHHGKIHSFCAVIEVKTHPPELVTFSGAHCTVEYNGHPHDVTRQSNQQKYSVKGYIEANDPRRDSKAPWITNLIWLTDLPVSQLPNVDSNLVGMDSSWQDILSAIALTATRDGLVQTFSRRSYLRRIAKIFSRQLQASHLDRKRLEIITKKVLDRTRQQYAEKLGEQLLVYRGRGGTGKTVRLIQTAHQAYVDRGWRVILLTYNKALVADLQRLFALLGVKNSIGSGGISVRTIHGFMYDWLTALGVIGRGQDDFLERYETHKEEALAMLRAGAIRRDDIRRELAARSHRLAWDLILIDESQDWPTSERDLIYELYGHERVILADGVDQFVRGTDEIDWRAGIDTSESQIVSLRKSLRLKATLCRTVGHIADQIEFEGWNLEPVPEAYGGKVIVVTGDGLRRALHEDLSERNQSDGNEPIDMLTCVPPSWVEVTDGRRRSIVANRYREWGREVWDAVDPQMRNDFPKSLNQYRIVQYDSCRGLEGWVVTALGLDEFFEHKCATAEFSEEQRSNMFFDRETAALDYAKQWMMIPLTRAIDTLVLHVTDPDSYVGQMLAELRTKYPNEVEWRNYT